jgi:hypothetical protein
VKEILRYAQLKRYNISKEEYAWKLVIWKPSSYAYLNYMDTTLDIKNRATMSSSSRNVQYKKVVGIKTDNYGTN